MSNITYLVLADIQKESKYLYLAEYSMENPGAIQCLTVKVSWYCVKLPLKFLIHLFSFIKICFVVL